MAYDPYEVLGVARDADLGTIRAAYRKLAKEHHPDVDGARERWDELVSAYRLLSDPDARAYYDATGRIDSADPVQDRNHAFTLLAERITIQADRFVQAEFNPAADPRAMPVLENVRRSIARDLAETESALEVGRKQLVFMTDYAKRFTRKADAAGIDQVAAALAQRIELINDRIAHVEGAIRMMKLALDLLEEYEFAKDPAAKPASTSLLGGMSLFSTTSTTL